MTGAGEARRWYAEALRREEAGDPAGALGALDVAVRLDPTFADAARDRARILGALGRTGPAPAGPPAVPHRAPAPPARPDGPALLRYEVAYPERLSRWKIFLKWLLAFPHLVILYFFSMAVAVVAFLAWFAILFTGRYPRSFEQFVRMFLAWTGNAAAYVLLRDEYPPFGDDRYAPVTFELEWGPRLSRWRLFLKWLLILPNALVLSYFVLPTFLATVLMALVAVPLTGRYPEGLFRFAVGTIRWNLRLNAYMYLLTDRYPPFDMRSADHPSNLRVELQQAT